MKIAVLNGSPKGKYSITLQTVLYLQRKFPQHEFDIIHVGQKIKAFEKDLSEAKTRLEDADAILFSYPVYTFLAPSQLHRFIELIKGACMRLTLFLSYSLVANQTIKTEISAGFTPEILPACPRLNGRIRFSFSWASKRSPLISE